jgi:hypothetical protein
MHAHAGSNEFGEALHITDVQIQALTILLSFALLQMI